MPREQTSSEEHTVGYTSTTRETQYAPTASRGRVLNIALWALQALLAIQFAMDGLVKVIGDPTMVEMFATTGIGQWFRYVVGTLELAGAVGVLVPRHSGLAALGLVCLMVGATLTNLFILDASPLLTIVLLVAAALVARGRWPKTRTLAGRIWR
ncbi:MAG: DoxX family protein [Rubrobacter sp.]|nr:DoxX family protein [Rubrobacter sp.]